MGDPYTGEVSATLRTDAAVLRRLSDETAKTAETARMQERRLNILQDFLIAVVQATDASILGIGLRSDLREIIAQTNYFLQLNWRSDGARPAVNATQATPDDA